MGCVCVCVGGGGGWEFKLCSHHLFLEKYSISDCFFNQWLILSGFFYFQRRGKLWTCPRGVDLDFFYFQRGEGVVYMVWITFKGWDPESVDTMMGIIAWNGMGRKLWTSNSEPEIQIYNCVSRLNLCRGFFMLKNNITLLCLSSDVFV